MRVGIQIQSTKVAALVKAGQLAMQDPQEELDLDSHSLRRGKAGAHGLSDQDANVRAE